MRVAVLVLPGRLKDHSHQGWSPFLLNFTLCKTELYAGGLQTKPEIVLEQRGL